MLPFGLTIEKDQSGLWRIHLNPNLWPPAGKISETPYTSYEEALKAAKEGYYD